MKNNLTLRILAGLALICFSAASLSFVVSTIKPSKFDNVRSITISGESEVKVAPDSGMIVATIKDQAAVVADAQAIIDSKTNELIVALEKLGIEKKDISSNSYRTGPKYENGHWGNEDKIIAYEAVQTLEIKVQKIDIINNVVNVLGKLGISISGPNFKVGDNKEFKSKARIAAIENSKKEAQIVAKALDVKLGKVVKFTEDEQFVVSSPIFAFSRVADKGAAENTLLPGEEIVKAKVTIVYSIK